MEEFLVAHFDEAFGSLTWVTELNRVACAPEFIGSRYGHW